MTGVQTCALPILTPMTDAEKLLFVAENSLWSDKDRWLKRVVDPYPLPISFAPAIIQQEMPFQKVKETLNAKFIEREEEIDSLLLALISREHVLLLGPPGTAKSALAEEICKSLGGNLFSLLFTKFTTPEEVFGPISLIGL